MNDVPVKVIKGNKDIIAFFIHHDFNSSLSNSTFPTALKYADVKPVFKKDDKMDKKADKFFPALSKVCKDLYVTNSIHTLINFFQNSNEVFEKVLMLSIA